MTTLLSILTFAAGAPGGPKDAALPAQLRSSGFADTLSRALPGTAGEKTDEDSEADGSESERAHHADLSARPDWSREWSETDPSAERPTPEQSPIDDLQDPEAATKATTPAIGGSSVLEERLQDGAAESAADHVPDAADAPEGIADERLEDHPETNPSPAPTQHPSTGQHPMTQQPTTTELSEEASEPQERAPQERASEDAVQLKTHQPALSTPVPSEGPTASMPAPTPLSSVGSMPANRAPEDAESVHLTATTAVSSSPPQARPPQASTLQAAAVQSPPVPISPVQGAPAPQGPTLLPAGQLVATAQPLNTQLAAPIQHLLSSGEGVRTLTLNVAPEHVGPVTVRASFTAEGVRIELFAPQDTGREALRAMLGDLRRDLAGLGMSTGTSSLSVSDGQAPAHNPAHGQQGRGSEQQAGPPDPHAEQSPNQNPAGDDANDGSPEEHDQLPDQPSRRTTQGLDIFA